MPLLTTLLYPNEQLAQRSDLVEAHKILGACRFDTGRADDARTEFEKVLQLQPDTGLSDLLFSSGSIRLFEDTAIWGRPLLLLGFLLFLTGVNFLCFGLLAELLVRTYHESQGKPIYSVRE